MYFTDGWFLTVSHLSERGVEGKGKGWRKEGLDGGRDGAVREGRVAGTGSSGYTHIVLYTLSLHSGL